MRTTIFFLFLFSLSGCDKPPFVESVKSFWVKNNSKEGIAVLRSYQYPDTSLPDKKSELSGVAIGKEAPYDYSKKKWRELFEEHPSDTTLIVFILSSDTLAKYSWQQVRSGYKILKRYDLNGNSLKAINHTIVYP